MNKWHKGEYFKLIKDVFNVRFTAGTFYSYLVKTIIDQNNSLSIFRNLLPKKIRNKSTKQIKEPGVSNVSNNSEQQNSTSKF